MFTAGCDSVKRIFFLSALLYLRRRSSRSSGVWWWGGWTPRTQTLSCVCGGGRSWFAFGGGVSGPARDLTSAWLRGSAGPGEELISSRFPLPAGTTTMKVKERWGRGRRLDSSAHLPCGPGQAPSPRPRLLLLFRGSGEVIPQVPGLEGVGICSRRLGWVWNFSDGSCQLPSLTKSEPEGSSSPNFPQLPPPKTCAPEGRGAVRVPERFLWGSPSQAPRTLSGAAPCTLGEATRGGAGALSAAPKGEQRAGPRPG